MNEVLHVTNTFDQLPPPAPKVHGPRGRKIIPQSKLIREMPRKTSITFLTMEDFRKAQIATHSIRSKKGNKKNFIARADRLTIWRTA